MVHRNHMYWWGNVLNELVLWKRTRVSIGWLKPNAAQRRQYYWFMRILREEGRATKQYHTGVFKSIREELSYIKNFRYKQVL